MAVSLKFIFTVLVYFGNMTPVVVVAAFIQQTSSFTSPTINLLYEYGKSHGDQNVTKGDDISSDLIELSTTLRFFGQDYRSLYVNVNGAISLARKVPQFTPQLFPILGPSENFLAIFWSDIDTRGLDRNKTDINNIYFREERRQEYIFRIGQDISRAYPNIGRFIPTWCFIATWHKVGEYPSQVNKLNTFQIAFAKNEAGQTFAIYNYGVFEWISHYDVYVGAGFNTGRNNKGDYYNMPGSMTPQVEKWVSTSNVGVPGRWIFQIDDYVESCGKGAAFPSITPSFGSVYGGYTLTVSGICVADVRSPVCRIASLSKTIFTIASKLNNVSLTCVAPFWNKAELVTIEFLLSDDNNPSASNNFTTYGLSFMYSELENIIHLETSAILDVVQDFNKNELTLSWSGNFLKQGGLVNLEFWNFEQLTQNQWDVTQKVLINSNLTNNGRAIVYLEKIKYIPPSFFVVVVQKSFQERSQFELVSEHKQHIVSPTPFISPFTEKDKDCKLWKEKEVYEKVPNWLDILSETHPCPRSAGRFSGETLALRELASGAWLDDNCCSSKTQNWIIKLVCGENCKFHPGARFCIRSKAVQLPDKSLAGQQCCYGGDSNNLLTDPLKGAGTADRRHEDNFVMHFIKDVDPFNDCCYNGLDTPSCKSYFDKRPPNVGKFYRPRPLIMNWGDPHVITADGFSYSFNGFGVYTLLQCPETRLVVQAATKILGKGTVYMALALKEGDGPVGQLSFVGNEVLVAFNNKIIDLNSLQTQTIENMMLIILNGSYSFEVSSGFGVLVNVEHQVNALTFSLNLVDSLFGCTSGLLGTFNGNPDDDFTLPNGNVLNSNLNASEIYYNFGEQWKVKIQDSLFNDETKQAINNLISNVSYMPMFEPEFSNEVIAAQAKSACQGKSVACLFDIAATNNFAFAELAEIAQAKSAESAEINKLFPKPSAAFDVDTTTSSSSTTTTTTTTTTTATTTTTIPKMNSAGAASMFGFWILSFLAALLWLI